jgi:orotidine-5'-phosphate decarboxylase
LNTKIFAVTALTSLEDEDTQKIYDETAKYTVLKLAKEALEA